MAFSKMAGLAVTPRTPSSSTMRHSSPDWISLRPITSSHALCPNSFNLAAGFMLYLLVFVRAPWEIHSEIRPAIFCGVMP